MGKPVCGSAEGTKCALTPKAVGVLWLLVFLLHWGASMHDSLDR